MRSIGLFMSQPIIREYVNMLDASGESSFSIENDEALNRVGKMFPTKKEVLNKAKIDVTTNTMTSTISKYYKDKQNLTDIENAQQRLLLGQFVSYYKMAKNLFDVTQAINYDTTSFKNADDLYKKELTTALNNEINPISSPSKILNSSHLGTLAKTLDRAGIALGEILKFNKPEFRNILERVIYQYASNPYLSKDKFSRVAEKLSASFLDYIIQTNMSTLDLTSLVIDSNSVANRIEAAKVLYPEVKILKDFVMESSGVMGGAKTIKLRANVKEVYDENLYIGYMREMKSHPQLRDLYNDIIKLSIIQGTYQSAVSIKNIVPLEDYAAIVAPIMKTLKVDNKLNQFYKDVMFQRNNWKDKNVVPRARPSFYLDEGGGYDPLITIDSNDIEIYQYSTKAFPEIPELGISSGQRKIMLLSPRSKGAINSVVTVPRITTVGNTENMVDFITGETVTKAEFAMRKQAGDTTIDEIYGYKRLEDSDGEPIVTDRGMHIYKQINLLGDGQYASEYKLFPTPSPINNGTVKIEQELPDNDIIRYLLKDDETIIPSTIQTYIPNEPVTGRVIVPAQAPVVVSNNEVSKAYNNAINQLSLEEINAVLKNENKKAATLEIAQNWAKKEYSWLFDGDDEHVKNFEYALSPEAIKDNLDISISNYGGNVEAAQLNNQLYQKIARLTLSKEAPEAVSGELAALELPVYTINKDLKNTDGTKRFAQTNGTQITLNPVNSAQEFFDYFEGKEGGPTSLQKQKVLYALSESGWSIDRIKSTLNTNKLINTFLILHEQSHIDNNDKDVYWVNGKDLMTDDKIKIETRASLDALNKLAPGVQQFPDKQLDIKDEKCK